MHEFVHVPRPPHYRDTRTVRRGHSALTQADAGAALTFVIHSPRFFALFSF